MSPSIWTFGTYKGFLSSVVNEGKRGFITRLSEAAGCQRSYLSNVIRSHIHLVPDQAYGICRYLNLDPDETNYFLLLLEKDRAGTPAYKKHLERKLHELRKERENLARRLDRSPLQSEADQLLYYSAWYYAAIHILVSIPKFQSIGVVSRALGLDEQVVSSTLEDLSKMGLVVRSSSRWSFLSGDIHISKGSPLVSLHHSNWRQRAVLNSQAEKDGLHFTMVQSVSKAVSNQIKEKVLALIEEASSLAGPSEPEDLLYLGIDTFQIAQG